MFFGVCAYIYIYFFLYINKKIYKIYIYIYIYTRSAAKIRTTFFSKDLKKTVFEFIFLMKTFLDISKIQYF